MKLLLLQLLGLFSKSSVSQICDSNNLNCISCTEYQKCVGSIPEGKIFSCQNGSDCSESELKLCQERLNCYDLDECTESGIFPDSLVDSNFYVCMSDGGEGFLKYEFTCSEGNFFDPSGLVCVSRSLTSVAFDEPVSASTVEGPDTSISAETDPPSSPSPTDPTPPTETDPTSSPTLTDPTPNPTETDPTSSPSISPTDPTPSSTSTDPTPSPTPADPTQSTETDSTPSPPLTDPTSSPSPSDPTPSPSETDPTPSPTPTDPTSSLTPTDPTPSTSTDPTSAPTETVPTEPPPFSCPTPGIFPNPTNCKMYYRCSTSLKAFYYICPGNSYFNENILKCSMIISPSCQEQILKNSTSTIPTAMTTVFTTTTPLTTIPPSTTTTTAPPTTTTPTTTTTTTTPSPPTTNPPVPTQFSCPGPGIFANPSDCKIYYKCSSSGKIYRYVCPGNSFFNEFTNRCSLTLTPRCKSLISG